MTPEVRKITDALAEAGCAPILLGPSGCALMVCPRCGQVEVVLGDAPRDEVDEWLAPLGLYIDWEPGK